MAVSIATAPPTLAEDEQFHVKVLRLRDAVLAGKHAQIKLPASAIEQLRARLSSSSQQNGPFLSAVRSPALVTVDYQQQSQPPTGLKTVTANGLAEPRTSSSGLDPIFLQKSPNLVRAEGVMKRQRIERDLELQVEQRKRSARDKDHGQEGLFFDVNAILLSALERVKPVSGLKPEPQPQPPMTAASSFDENDYYSSHVHSDWSSDASSSKGSDKLADVSRSNSSKRNTYAAESSATATARALHTIGRDLKASTLKEPVQLDDDDDYTPPDATAFEEPHMPFNGINNPPPAHYDDDLDNEGDEDDDYEPGEITHDSIAQAPRPAVVDSNGRSPYAPVIRNNHLTHIAAPQPNRVSPLATAKGPTIELELVNGRPEVVQRPQPHHRGQRIHSRASTGSPIGNGAGMGRNARKKAKQKRKRQSDHDVGRDTSAKKRRDRQVEPQSPITPVHAEPYIKPEPLSPPPLQQLNDAPAYLHQPVLQRSNRIDLSSPHHQPLQTPYANHAPPSALRHEYAPQSSGAARLASPAGLQPAKRNSQDLRRVASLHYAQRPPSPPRHPYSPNTPYRTVSHTYGQYQQPTPLSAAPEMGEPPTYHGSDTEPAVRYVRAVQPRSPPRMQDHPPPYQSRAQTPAQMPPPPPPPRKIIVDQFGRRYYAAEPVQELPRSSTAQIERRVPQTTQYGPRAPSRAAYDQPVQVMQYEPVNSRPVLPSAVPGQILDQGVGYADPSGHRYREYSSRPTEIVHYAEPPTSPVYQQVLQYEQMPPPQLPSAREQTAPAYAPARTYSVRPEEPQRLRQQQVVPNYVRQGSVAPVQYLRQEVPPPLAARAMSVIPSADYGAAHNAYAYPPAAVPEVRYVDQYGRAVHPPSVRQASEFRY